MKHLFRKKSLTFLMIATFLVGGFFVSTGGALAEEEGVIVWKVDVTTTGSSCTTAAPICNTIQSAVAASKSGDTININSGDYTITETIIVNKAITIQGAAGFGTRILTSGSNPVFNLNSTSVVLDGLFIQKIDKTNQHLVTITANDVTVKNSKFIGKYVQGDGEVVRAITPNAGITGYVIDGNSFDSVRQPSYLEGAGTVTNNFVKNTRGWVVCVNHAITFSQNTFEGNAVDIAIIANGQTSSENYKDVMTVSNSNSGAYVENQLIGASAKNGALYKTISISSSSDGAIKYFKTIQEAISVATSSDTINVAAGTYKLDSQIRIEKAIKLIGAGDTTILTTGDAFWTNSTGSKGHASIITIVASTSPVTLENIMVTGARNIVMTVLEVGKKDYGHGLNIFNSSNVTLNNVTSTFNSAAGLIVNSSKVTANNLNTSGNTWYGVNVDKTDASFTLTGNGVITEIKQIFSENPNLVTVSAIGYTPYSVTDGILWSNKPKAITNFTVSGQIGDTTIDEANHTIKMTVPFGTDITSLVSSFVTTGNSVTIGTTTQASATTTNNFTNPITYTVTAVDTTTQDYVVTVEVAAKQNNGGGNGGNGGGGGISFIAPCSDITYGDWKIAVNGIEYRDIIKQAPNTCALTATQQSGRSRAVFLNNEIVKTEKPVNNNSSTITPEPIKQVLGEKKYANGTLLRATNKIYVVLDNKLQYISSLKELAKYRGPILKVSGSVISSFEKTAILDAKKYANGTLIKAKGDVKIYVIKDGKKIHIKSLAELRKQKGKTLIVEASELNNY